MYWDGSEYVDVPGSIDVSINVHSIGDFVAYHDEWDDDLWEYKATGFVKTAVDVTIYGVDLHLKLMAHVKKVYASPYLNSYHMLCELKNQMYGMYVLLNADPVRVWLQALAPYLGIDGHAYGALPVADGDFSFTYNH